MVDRPCSAIAGIAPLSTTTFELSAPTRRSHAQLSRDSSNAEIAAWFLLPRMSAPWATGRSGIPHFALRHLRPVKPDKRFASLHAPIASGVSLISSSNGEAESEPLRRPRLVTNLGNRGRQRSGGDGRSVG